MLSRRRKCKWVTSIILFYICHKVQLLLIQRTTQFSSSKRWSSHSTLLLRLLFVSVFGVPSLNQFFADNADDFCMNLHTPCCVLLPTGKASPCLLSKRDVTLTPQIDDKQQSLKTKKTRPEVTSRIEAIPWMNQPAVFANTPTSHTLFAVKVTTASGERSTNLWRQFSLSPLVLIVTALWTRSWILLMINCSPHRILPRTPKPQPTQSTGAGNHNSTALKKTMPKPILRYDVE